MNFSLKPHPLIAHWVPGVVVLVTALLAWRDWSVSKVLATFAGDASRATVSVLVLSVVAFVIGEILDSFRNCREDHAVNWDFFFEETSEEKVERLNNYYFTYYVLEKNLKSAINLALLIFVGWACWKLWSGNLFSYPQIGWAVPLFLLAVFAIFILHKDSESLRVEIIKHTNGPTAVPHRGVFTRLKPSKIDEDGVGVFAIRKIPDGAHIFHGDEDSKMVKINKSELEGLSSELRKLYDDFCIIENQGELYRCPKNFNLMTISWYLNESRAGEQPNVRCGENDLFYALRDIDPGEELTVDYETYNEFK
jgi:hypothetical protein